MRLQRRNGGLPDETETIYQSLSQEPPNAHSQQTQMQCLQASGRLRRPLLLLPEETNILIGYVFHEVVQDDYGDWIEKTQKF
jgi:hypothetical protein